MNTCNILVVGDGNVGKTSLIQYMMNHERFNDRMKKENELVPEFSEMRWSDTTMLVRKKPDLVIIMFDMMTNNIWNITPEMWRIRIGMIAQPDSYIVVGNKIDRPNRKIDRRNRKIADDPSFISISVKTGVGCDSLMEMIADSV
jgi:GTPase SAR1 family protein